ncbi:MAG: acetamidase/formamidase family protein [Chloroflexota bacterium]
MHTITPTEKSLHGYWSRELDPILTVNPGETVRYSTLDAKWHSYDAEADTLIQSPQYKNDPLKGHALCGPIEIAGAKKGQVLEIAIGEIVTAPRGWNLSGGEPRDLWQRLGTAEEPLHRLEWSLDNDAKTATTIIGGKNYTVKLAPFMGVLGMPPDEPGQHTTRPPYVHGGNIDCKMLTAGSKLFLPIPVDGAFFSTGDGHAAQGDGEVSIYAIECPIALVDLTFTLHDMEIITPRAHTDEGLVTFGFHEDLNEAMMIALNAMLDLMVATYGITRKDALALASVAVDLRITQIVNTTQGVHAVLPHDAITL